MTCDLIANSKLVPPLRQRYLNASYVKNIAIKTYKISVIFMFFKRYITFSKDLITESYGLRKE